MNMGPEEEEAKREEEDEERSFFRLSMVPQPTTAAPELRGPTSDLMEGSTEITRAVVEKGLEIAGALMHPELRIAHILLAVTLLPSALMSTRARDLNVKILRETCWQVLIAIEPGLEPVIVSKEVRNIFGRAHLESARREMENRRIEIDDILKAIGDSERFGEYFSGTEKQKTLSALDRLTAQVNELDFRSRATLDIFPRLQAHLDSIDARLSSIFDLQHRIPSVLERELATGRASEGALLNEFHSVIRRERRLFILFGLGGIFVWLLSGQIDSAIRGIGWIIQMVSGIAASAFIGAVIIASSIFIGWMFISTLRASLSEYAKIGIYAASFLLAYELWLLVDRALVAGG